MINKMAKMRRTQLKAKKYFQEREYLTFTTPHTRWTKDVFGLFDLFALSKDEVALVQIKSGSMPKMKPYIDFSKRYPNIIVYIMSWIDRKGFKIRKLNGNSMEEWKT